jgi:hypothetical protein
MRANLQNWDAPKSDRCNNCQYSTMAVAIATLPEKLSITGFLGICRAGFRYDRPAQPPRPIAANNRRSIPVYFLKLGGALQTIDDNADKF